MLLAVYYKARLYSAFVPSVVFSGMGFAQMSYDKTLHGRVVFS
jgi:hypothetical protein